MYNFPHGLDSRANGFEIILSLPEELIVSSNNHHNSDLLKQSLYLQRASGAIGLDQHAADTLGVETIIRIDEGDYDDIAYQSKLQRPSFYDSRYSRLWRDYQR